MIRHTSIRLAIAAVILMALMVLTFKSHSSQEQVLIEDEEPAITQEDQVIDYIIEKVNAYVKSQSWFEVDDFQKQVERIEAILTEYGYNEDHHYVEIKAVGRASDKKIVWLDISVVFYYKAEEIEDEILTSVNLWRIFFQPMPMLEEQEEGGGA